jgi:phosphopantothenoylcysteine decarboxylase/phosphopantothenate--cysteine ligase
MARIVLGVGGGIAAYKACELLRRLAESGHSVTVVPTRSALNFVGAATWAALSGKQVTSEIFDDVDEVRHVRLGQEAELVVVAPATANLVAKAAHGIADDLLTNVLLTASCPVVLAPAMHTEMWDHPATQANVATLRARGVTVLEPAVGRLTGVDFGKGRLPEPEELAVTCEQILRRGSVAADLAGRLVVVSAGGTREPIDPVRYLGNRSSGRQGYALAATAAGRGARVVLVAANVELPDPAGVDVIRVETAAQLSEAVLAAASSAEVVVMAAAVADFRPAQLATHKLKKGEIDPVPIALVRNDDVLSTLVTRRQPGQVIVGFAAETGDETTAWLEHGSQKLQRKGCDLLVVNQVGEGIAFGTEDNAAVVLAATGEQTPVELGPKHALADVVWDLVVRRLS